MRDSNGNTSNGTGSGSGGLPTTNNTIENTTNPQENENSNELHQSSSFSPSKSKIINSIALPNGRNPPPQLHISESESDGEESTVEKSQKSENLARILSPHGERMHCRIITAFSNAFAKQNVHFEKAISDLDLLNEQIITFVSSPELKTADVNVDVNKSETNCDTVTDAIPTKHHQEILRASIGLMRNLLLDAQGKFKTMVEENKALAGRLDGDLQSANNQMAMIRAELTDTNKRILQLSSPPTTPTTPNSHTTDNTGDDLISSSLSNSPQQQPPQPPQLQVNGCSSDGKSSPFQQMNGNGNSNKNSTNNGHHNNISPLDDSELTEDSEELNADPNLTNLSTDDLKNEAQKLSLENQKLRKELKELRKPPIPKRGDLSHINNKNKIQKHADSTTTEINSITSTGSAGSDLETQLNLAKEALSALKADRKRLKAEKFELLNQMKQLYATLEDKEKELRDFIRNYEQRMRESEIKLQQLSLERDEAERERWTILRHCTQENERGLAVVSQLNCRESQVQQLQEELREVKRQLAQYGIYSEPDRSDRSHRSDTTVPNTSHYSLVSSLTATYATLGDRGSSADSGVRLSSDRDSSGGHTLGGNGGNLSDSPNEAISIDLYGDGSGDGDTMSVISTATLPQLFRDSPGPMSFSSMAAARSMEANTLSRSAEQLLAQEAAEARRKANRSSGRNADLAGQRSTGGVKGAWGSISRAFARNKHRRTLDTAQYDAMHAGKSATLQRSSWSPHGSVVQSPMTEQESYGDKLRYLEEAATLPMELWRAQMVESWITISLGMTQYGSRCEQNVKSGKVLLELSDSDLERELGISHPLHRKKLRLAIEEHRNPALVRYPCIVELSHVWVSSELLPDIGLPQYAENFAVCLVDARLLDHLSKKDLEKYLGVTRKFHLASIAHGVHLLRIVAYDRQALAERRRMCDNDPLVWTNQHFVQWARSIDLIEYSENLKGSGVHGAFAVLEPSFNGDTLANAMGIPQSKQIIRRHLNAELDALLNPARAKITQQYRMTNKRLIDSTNQNQRMDSLSRNAVNPNSSNSDSFRRSTNNSTDDSRRKTSLRTYSQLVVSKGSLSRALGLKIKQDMASKRQELEKRKADERQRDLVAQAQASSNIYVKRTSIEQPSTHRVYREPPPIPGHPKNRDGPGLPGKYSSGSATQSLNEESVTILTPIKSAHPIRPHSVLNNMMSVKVSCENGTTGNDGHDPNEHNSILDSPISSNSISESAGESLSESVQNEPQQTKVNEQGTRVKSFVDEIIENVGASASVHTPV